MKIIQKLINSLKPAQITPKFGGWKNLNEIHKVKTHKVVQVLFKVSLENHCLEEKFQNEEQTLITTHVSMQNNKNAACSDTNNSKLISKYTYFWQLINNWHIGGVYSLNIVS